MLATMNPAPRRRRIAPLLGVVGVVSLLAVALPELSTAGEAVFAAAASPATVKIDNPEVRVTEWRFRPGAHTGHHRHEYAYVVVPHPFGSLDEATVQARADAALERIERLLLGGT